MTLEKLKSDWEATTGLVSARVREIALAGIAVIWMVRVGGEDSGGLKWDSNLNWCIFAFLLSLSFDLAQYLWKACFTGGLAAWHYSRLLREARTATVTEEMDRTNVKVDVWWVRPVDILFFAKIAACLAGIIYLLMLLWGSLFARP